MRVLAIETSAAAGGVALRGPEGGIAEAPFEGERNHAAELGPRLRRLLEANGGLEAVDGYAISIGPGSFTGLRIGVSFLKGLAAVHPRPAVGVSSLCVRAVQALESRPAPACLAVIDARREEVFAGLFDGEGRPDLRLPDGLYAAADIPALMGAALVGAAQLETPIGGRWTAVGDEVVQLPESVEWVATLLAVPRASTVARLGREALLAGRGVDAGALDPAYLQRSAAEVNLGVSAPEDRGLNLMIDDGSGEVDPTRGAS